jgi:hypothetical protein
MGRARGQGHFKILLFATNRVKVVRGVRLARLSLIKVFHVEILALLCVPSFIISFLLIVLHGALWLNSFPTLGRFLESQSCLFFDPLRALMRIMVDSLLPSLCVPRSNCFLLVWW